MTDLSEESLPEWTDEELAVLRSADGDAPPPRSLGATLAAVSASGAIATGAAAAKGAAIAGSTATSAKWGGVGAALKWLAVVAVGGAVVTSGAVLVRRATRGPERAVKPEERTVSPKVPEPPPATVEEAPAIAAPVASGVPEPALAAPSPPLARSVVPPQPDISLEIAALDAARSALRAGRAMDALSALDRYDASFSRNGSLRVEATALRIEALLKSGNRARATSLANAFLARNPKSPYAARVRALVQTP